LEDRRQRKNYYIFRKGSKRFAAIILQGREKSVLMNLILLSGYDDVRRSVILVFSKKIILKSTSLFCFLPHAFETTTIKEHP